MTYINVSNIDTPINYSQQASYLFILQMQQKTLV